MAALISSFPTSAFCLSTSDKTNMWRHLDRIATTLSLAICASAAVLCLRSYFVRDGIAWRDHEGDPWKQVVSSHGRIEAQWWKPELECGLSSRQTGVSISHYPPGRWDVRSPSTCGFGSYRPSTEQRYVAVPH